jgi:alanyl-tRNA synthetase
VFGIILLIDQLIAIEKWADEASRSGTGVDITEMDKKDAMKRNAMALFSENYGDIVRVVSIPGFSTELCGGTHTKTSRETYPIRIISEGPIAAGLRRIEAVSGDAAIQWLSQNSNTFGQMANTLGIPRVDLPATLTSLREGKRELEKEITSLRTQLIQSKIWPQLTGQMINGSKDTVATGTRIVIHLLASGDASGTITSSHFLLPCFLKLATVFITDPHLYGLQLS